MSYPKTDPWAPVIVTWEDCETKAGETQESVTTALASYKPCIRCTVGYWIGVAKTDGRTAVLVATDDDRGHETGGFGGISYIPIGMVLSVTKLGEPLGKVWKP